MPDLTIKTRCTADRTPSTVTTEVLYIHGTRRRHEHIAEFPGAVAPHRTVTLALCDSGRTIGLFPETKTYFEDQAHSARRGRTIAERWAARQAAKATHATNSATPPRPVVTVTIETIDTGERRQVGSLTARRVTTTRTTVPGPGASTRPRTDTIDGWYVDVSRRCPDDESFGFGVLVALAGPAGQPMDLLDLVQRGKPERGHPIEMIERTIDDGETFTLTTTLRELSEAPLDADFFEVPKDYRPALRLPGGGCDPGKPDSIVNRAGAYWDWIGGWARWVIRIGFRRPTRSL